MTQTHGTRAAPNSPGADPNDTRTLMGTALRYASWDWLVFPCRPGGKEPLTPNGYKDAMTYPPTIIDWWTRWPDANVGIATGEPGPDVVDIDVKDGRPGGATLERLRRAGLLRGTFAMVSTPSGGAHLYFTGTTQRCGARERHGIDFRSDGGYVVGPGSVVDGRRYIVEMHRPRDTAGTVDWAAICRFLEPPRPTFSGTGAPAAPGLAAWARTKLEQLLEEPVLQGQRSERFHALVGVCKDAGMSLLETVTTVEPWCDASGKFAGRVDREVERCWGKVGAR